MYIDFSYGRNTNSFGIVYHIKRKSLRLSCVGCSVDQKATVSVTITIYFVATTITTNNYTLLLLPLFLLLPLLL